VKERRAEQLLAQGESNPLKTGLGDGILVALADSSDEEKNLVAGKEHFSF